MANLFHPLTQALNNLLAGNNIFNPNDPNNNLTGDYIHSLKTGENPGMNNYLQSLKNNIPGSDHGFAENKVDRHPSVIDGNDASDFIDGKVRPLPAGAVWTVGPSGKIEGYTLNNKKFNLGGVDLGGGPGSAGSPANQPKPTTPAPGSNAYTNLQNKAQQTLDQRTGYGTPAGTGGPTPQITLDPSLQAGAGGNYGSTVKTPRWDPAAYAAANEAAGLKAPIVNPLDWLKTPQGAAYMQQINKKFG